MPAIAARHHLSCVLCVWVNCVHKKHYLLIGGGGGREGSGTKILPGSISSVTEKKTPQVNTPTIQELQVRKSLPFPLYTPTAQAKKKICELVRRDFRRAFRRSRVLACTLACVRVCVRLLACSWKAASPARFDIRIVRFLLPAPTPRPHTPSALFFWGPFYPRFANAACNLGPNKHLSRFTAIRANVGERRERAHRE